VVLVTVAVTASALSGCSQSAPTPQATLTMFLAAWNRGDWTAMSQYVDRPAPDFASAGPMLTSELRASSATHTLGPVTHKGSSATAEVASRYVLPGVGPWGVNTTINLTERSGHWLVEWSPSVIDPALQAGSRLVFMPTWAPRAPILGLGGAPLTGEGPIVIVGVEGSRIKDPGSVSALLVSAGASSAQVEAALAAAAQHPTLFEPVFTLTQARFDQLGGRSSSLYQIAGTVFEPTTARTAVTPGLAAHMVGTVGPVTAAQLHQLGPPYDSSSRVGQIGLEAAYQSQLAGQPGGTVTAVAADGKTTTSVAVFAPKPGTAVETSIDPAVQQAAEAALAPVSQYAALVAVRASTGQILAAVSVPEAYQFDQALDGEFPPGSTFKVITATALIDKGLSPASPASCPPTLSVDGELFHNAEGDAPISDMAGAFAESCNTAFISLATANLQLDSLPGAAALYGIGTTPQVGLPAFGGSVPTPRDEAGLAQTAIGQAQVVASPLNMAMVAAAVDTGVVRAPRLVAGASGDTTAVQQLPEAVTAGLQQMMAEVVTSGTAAGTGLPPGTHAKTGTAEYGTGSPQPTDAWLIGYRGDLAFAMVLQGTGNGGPTDGPIVARFLDALGQSGA
jgi:cell division protein FtsI/penicillin-binding protein 2